MTIRLAPATPHAVAPRHGAFILYAGGTALAIADTPEEGEQAKHAFENVLLPRFTRDEAIALCKAPRSIRFVMADGSRQAEPSHTNEEIWAAGYDAGMRAALEALAAASVFSDAGQNPHELARELDAATTRDKLDAAGIR